MQTLTKTKTTVLISGASIAGPAFALWLVRYGFEVTVVEKASEVRRGGQAVDFKGDTHRTVLERMGILDAVLQNLAPSGEDAVVVNAQGHQIATIPAAFSAGEIETARGDLARLLFERTKGTCDYIFDDSIASLEEREDGVAVTFQYAAARIFDLVVGADGIHSNVRRLAFGPESQYVHHLGYCYALAEFPGQVSREDMMYNEPGRMMAIGGSKAPAFFVFASEPPTCLREDIERQKAFLAAAYEGASWKVPQFMKDLCHAENFYMDSICRVIANRYAKGRIVLLGDAAYGCALGGFGTGLAIVGAYVLAGELRRAEGNYPLAYARYEEKFRKYAKVSQKVNAGKLLAPSTRFGIFARNRMFSTAVVFQGIIKLVDHFASDIDLEDYTVPA